MKKSDSQTTSNLKSIFKLPVISPENEEEYSDRCFNEEIEILENYRIASTVSHERQTKTKII